MTSPADSFVCRIADEPALEPLAARLVAALPDHAFVALHGDLGAGKTTFVKAVAAAAGLDPREVISPTFGLIHDHPGRHAGRPLHLVHADLYRLTGPEELREIGWDDCLAARPDATVWAFVEWPQRIATALPADRLDIAIDIVSETARTLTLTPRGPAHRAVVAALRSPADSPPLPAAPIS